MEKNLLPTDSEEAAVDNPKAAMLAVGVPAALVDETFRLTHTYGPELLTAVLGAMGIHLINTGSSRYADINETMSSEEKREIVQDASGKVLGGTAALATVAFAAGNPLFAIPEVAALLTSLRPYLDSRFPSIASLSRQVRADIALAGTAAVAGVATSVAYARNAWDVLPPFGLSALSAAFAIGGEKAREKLYRVLTVTGGSTMVLGSAHAMSEAIGRNDGIGAVMSGVFLALNAFFTRNELLEVRKMMLRHDPSTDGDA